MSKEQKFIFFTIAKSFNIVCHPEERGISGCIQRIFLFPQNTRAAKVQLEGNKKSRSKSGLKTLEIFYLVSIGFTGSPSCKGSGLLNLEAKSTR